MLKRVFTALMLIYALCAFKTDSTITLPRLEISGNHRFFVAGNKPFFWIADTGWLLFSKMSREETEQYLQKRSKQGFNTQIG